MHLPTPSPTRPPLPPQLMSAFSRCFSLLQKATAATAAYPSFPDIVSLVCGGVWFCVRVCAERGVCGLEVQQKWGALNCTVRCRANASGPPPHPTPPCPAPWPWPGPPHGAAGQRGGNAGRAGADAGWLAGRSRAVGRRAGAGAGTYAPPDPAGHLRERATPHCEPSAPLSNQSPPAPFQSSNRLPRDVESLPFAPLPICHCLCTCPPCHAPQASPSPQAWCQRTASPPAAAYLLSVSPGCFHSSDLARRPSRPTLLLECATANHCSAHASGVLWQYCHRHHTHLGPVYFQTQPPCVRAAAPQVAGPPG